MAPKIKHKRSAVAGKAPQPADLDYGEIAVNYEASDPALYVKDSANVIRKIGTQPDATETVKGIVQLADAAAITAGTAGRVVDAAQLKAENLWDRAGTVVSPANAGDQVHTATGKLTVGGTAAAPAVSIDPGATGSPLVRTSSGSIGVGILAPQPNAGTFKGIQLGLAAHMYGRSDDSPLFLTNNLHWTGSGWAYTAGTSGSMMTLATDLIFATAPIGTAGAAAVTTERMRLGSNGVLTLGDSATPAVSLDPGTTGSPLVRDASGKVGVGDPAPDSTVTIKAAASTTPLRVSGPSSEFLRCDQQGRLLVGTSTTDDTVTGARITGTEIRATNTDQVCYFNRQGSDGTIVNFNRSNVTVGTISVTTSATAYNTSSDYRLKENVAPVTDGIIRLQQLKPSRFNFIADPKTVVDGFIAHEVQTIVPEAITGEKDAVDAAGNPIYQSIDQSKLVPLLTAALQEAVTKIESLEARLTAAGI